MASRWSAEAAQRLAVELRQSFEELRLFSQVELVASDGVFPVALRNGVGIAPGRSSTYVDIEGNLMMLVHYGS